MDKLNELSTSELITVLGKRFKQYRIRMQMTQEEIAEMSGVSAITIHRFENGLSRNVSLSVFLLLLKALGQTENIDRLLPELETSFYQYSDTNKKIQRIRHQK